MASAASTAWCGGAVQVNATTNPSRFVLGSALFAAIDLDGNGLEQPLKLGDVQVLERP